MRNRFNEQLEQLNVGLIKMGAQCEEAISAACKALLEGDRDMGERAADLEREIDGREREIENLCMDLLLRQQPVAGDLRTVSAAMRMIADMERIGDQAADIAEIARDLRANSLGGALPMADLAREAVGMVTESVDSFVRRDQGLAHAVIQRDDKVDALFLGIREELTRQIAAGAPGDVCLDLLMTAKYFERIGDHATNIAEWVIFSVTGVHKEG